MKARKFFAAWGRPSKPMKPPPGSRIVPNFTLEDHLVAIAGPQRLADQQLVVAGAVEVAGVEQVDARVQRGVDGGDALRLVGRTVEVGHPHAAQTEGRDPGAAGAQISHAHAPEYGGSLATLARIVVVPAIFGIDNDGLNLAVNLLILFLVVVWLALVYWTYADARRRIADPMLVGCATAASLFPFVGTIVYAIVRPPEYLADVRERELEIQAAEARLAELHYSLCPHCDYVVERDFLRCPSCLRKLQGPVPELREAARPGVDDLPVLRDRARRDADRRRGAAAAAASDRRVLRSARRAHLGTLTPNR